MANIEFIEYTPMREVVEDGEIRWVPDKLGRKIHKLPQIFWDNGEPWSEANHWALTKAMSTVGGDIGTVRTVMKHLAAYASWLYPDHDWRHFPMRKQDRPIVQFRGELIAQRTKGTLAPSTTSARMAAVIQFYRHAQVYGFVDRNSPMWTDRGVVVRYIDTAGFERSLSRLSSDLSIPNKSSDGFRLEDGLTPLRNEDAARLLEFTKDHGPKELHLMLALGVLSGPRIGTITTLKVRDIENAYPDIQAPDTYLLRVGPGTGVKTKGDVSGNLMVPKFLIDALKAYASSVHRLTRQARASESNRERLFLTTRGSPYEQGTLRRLMTDLRRDAVDAGLQFMQRFKFHQTRATFGTWLMGMALRVTNTKAAVAFVRDAMLHKNERTTFLYVRFHEDGHVKVEMANQYTNVFSGAVNRDWKQYGA